MDTFQSLSMGKELQRRWVDQKGSGAVQRRAGIGEKPGPALPSFLPSLGNPAGPGGLPVNDIILSSGLLETQGTPPKGVLRPHPQHKAASPVRDGERMEET